MTKAEAFEKLRGHLPGLRAAFGVSAIRLFGSVARGDARPDSDVDLLVHLERPMGLFRFLELQLKLEEILGAKVDIGTEASLKPRVRDRVLAEALDVA